MSDVWAPLRYGWSHTYWLTVEGIDTLWCERALSKTLPTGYASESATLSIDGSARVGCMIERGAGIGAGFPLSFRLLDLRAGDSGASAADYMIRPTAQTYLTADETSTDATISIASTSGLTSPVWIGRERVTYSGTGAGPTLTGCTRGTVGLPGASVAYPHKAGTIVTSGAPRYWRGRHVALYAQASDPTGYAPGSTWLSTSVCIWRGVIDAEPQRSSDGDGWDFQAMALDRLLARPLSGEWTGTVADTEPRFAVTADALRVDAYRYNQAAALTHVPMVLTPFADAGYTYGTWISVSEANAAIKAAFDAAVTASGVGWMGGVSFVQATSAYSGTAIDKGDWVPVIELITDANTNTIVLDIDWFGVVQRHLTFNFGSGGKAVTEGYGIEIGYRLSPYSAGSVGETVPARVTVRIDAGDPGTLPASGQIVVGDDAYTYSSLVQTTDAALVQFAGLQPLGDTVPADVSIGATAKVVSAVDATLGAAALRLLHSSGESTLRGTYDSLPASMGYGLPTALVNDDAVLAALQSGWLGLLTLHVALSQDSLDDALSGVLRLSGRALCVVDGPDADAALTVIETAAVASGAAVALTDAHVITYPSRTASQMQIEAPASVLAKLTAGDVDCGTVRVVDVGRMASEGAQADEVTVPLPQRTDEAVLAIAGWGTARIVGDSLASVVEVDVVPWLDVRPGDAVDVTLTMPELWDWAAGTVGYTGRARCIGREVTLDTGVQRLRLVIDGQGAKGSALCPSAAVSAVAGGATTPTSVDIALAYVDIMTTALADTDPVRLLYYEPGGGAESTTYYLDVDGVTDTGSVCRLDVTAYNLPVGGVSTTQGWVSWPATATASTWQQQWMHDADGTRWV